MKGKGRIVIAGGTGQVGMMLERGLVAQGYQVVVLTRRPRANNQIQWDGETVGPWAEALEGARAVINLAGRSVNCRYTEENLRQMMDSRVNSTRAVGDAIAAASEPPAVWLQMSTATIYAHTFGPAHGEDGGHGGNEAGVPAYWKRSVDIAQAWEEAVHEANTPNTRKVLLRTAMVMSPDDGGVFDVLLGMTRKGLGGAIAGGKQYVSWIHEQDFVAACIQLIESDVSGAFNLAAPGPVPQGEFMASLRAAWGTRVGLPAYAWMAEIGAFFLRTDTELLLRSRRVVPQRLLALGFHFSFPSWPQAAEDLVSQWRGQAAA